MMGLRITEVFRGYFCFLHSVLGPLYSESSNVGTRTHDVRKLPADEVQSNTIVRCQTVHNLSALDQSLVSGPSPRFTIVVRAIAPFEEAQAGKDRQPAGKRIGESFFKPADRTGANSSEN